LPFKTFTAGEEALAAEVNTYLMKQAVAVFASTTERTAQLPTPTTGQISYIVARPYVYQFWTGGGWADLVTGIGGTYLQSGNSVVTTDGTGSGAVNFPTAFSAAPLAVALTDGAPWGGTANASVHLSLTNITAAGFGYRARSVLNDTAVVSASVRIIWFTHGVRV
jgi:hypothetical protein